MKKSISDYKERFLLIYTTWGSDYPPLGPLYVCDALEKSDIYCELLSSEISEKELAKYIEDIKPVAIGMSVMTSHEIPYFINHSKFIRENFPNIKIIWGGVHPTINSYQCSKEDFIDHIITGQVEETLPKMVHKIGKGEKLDRVVLGEGVKNLDAFSPRWDKLDIAKYVFPEEHSVHGTGKLEYDTRYNKRRQNIFYYLITSRGCLFNCTFCSENLDSMNRTPAGKKWNAHSFEWVKAEVEYIENELGKRGIKLDGIGIWDDMFWIDWERAYKILDYLKSKNIGYLLEARADQLLRNNNSLLKKLAKTGCMQVFIGGESADQSTLNHIKKGTKVEDYVKLIELSKKYHVAIRFSFIVGFPGESDKSVNKTIDFVEWMNNGENEYASVSGPKLLTPYPGTKEFQRAVEHGLVIPKNTMEWSKINRFTENYLEIFPWIKRNLRPETLERLQLILGQGKSNNIRNHRKSISSNFNYELEQEIKKI